MSRNKLIVVFTGILVVSFLLCRFVPDVILDSLLQQIILNAISILVGILIAILGIFLGSINGMYLSIYKILKTKDVKITEEEIVSIKTGLTEVVNELRDNALFTLFTFIFVVLLFFIKDSNFPFIKWFIDASIISKRFFCNWIIVAGMLSIFFATIDTTKTIFKINKLFELTKE